MHVSEQQDLPKTCVSKLSYRAHARTDNQTELRLTLARPSLANTSNLKEKRRKAQGDARSRPVSQNQLQGVGE